MLKKAAEHECPQFRRTIDDVDEACGQHAFHPDPLNSRKLSLGFVAALYCVRFLFLGSILRSNLFTLDWKFGAIGRGPRSTTVMIWSVGTPMMTLTATFHSSILRWSPTTQTDLRSPSHLSLSPTTPWYWLGST